MSLYSLRTQLSFFVVMVTLMALLGLGALFYHSVKDYHHQQAQAQMDAGFFEFKDTLSRLKTHLIVAESSFRQHPSFMANTRMISEYETPDTAQDYLFDHEKKSLAQTLHEGYLLGRYQQAYLFKPNGELISFFQAQTAQTYFGYRPGDFDKHTPQLTFESTKQKSSKKVLHQAQLVWQTMQTQMQETSNGNNPVFFMPSPYLSSQWLMTRATPIESLTGKPAGFLVLMNPLDALIEKNLFNDLQMGLYNSHTQAMMVKSPNAPNCDWQTLQSLLAKQPGLVETKQGLVQQFETQFGLDALKVAFLYPAHVYEQELSGVYQALWFSLLALILLVLPINYGVFHHTLHRPLSIFMGAIDRILKGDYHQKIDLKDKNEMGQLATAYNTMVDEIEAREDELKISAKIFESDVGMLITDKDNHIIQVNAAYSRMSGWPKEQLIGQSPKIFRSQRHSQAFFQRMWQTIEHHGSWSGEIWNQRKNGEVYPQWLTVTAVKNEQGVVTHYLGTAQDITDKKAAEDQITRLAFYDPLTHLANRRKLFSQLEELLVQIKAEKAQAAVFFIDLDDFKDLNDSRGHEIGDLFLVQVAQQLQTVMPEEDRLLARLGGDEFVAVSLKNLSTEAYQTQGLAIRRALNAPMMLEGKTYRSSPSIGMVVINQATEDVTEILKKADQAMYYAKRSGKNQLQIYTDDIDLAVQKKKQLQKDIDTAIAEDQFVLYYQPQICQDGTLMGVEALIRWQHPETGMVPPLEFISFAEETGQIVAIGDWVIRSACQQLSQWQQQPQTADLTIAVNVSIDQFMQDNFVTKTLRVIEETGIRPDLLKLELTENVFITQPDLITQKMAELKAIGVRFALDDFGTGYSSLSYLKSLPLDQLKIDQTFVRDLLEDENDEAIVSTVISLAKTLKLDVIAEGVETQVHQTRLGELGCHQYQGYYYSKPVPAEALSPFFTDSHANPHSR